MSKNTTPKKGKEDLTIRKNNLLDYLADSGNPKWTPEQVQFFANEFNELCTFTEWQPLKNAA